MTHRSTQSALVLAGAAAGVVAAAWLGKRRLTAVNAGSAQPEGAARVQSEGAARVEPGRAVLAEPERAGLIEPERAGLVEPEGAELPIGRSADPAIDETLSRTRLPQDETSGASLLGEAQSFPDASSNDGSLDEVWNSLPGIAEGEQSEGYDAVTPEDLGAVWLERATQTTHEARPHGSDPNDVPDLSSLMVSEATLSSSGIDQDDEIAEDELDEDEPDEDEPDEDEPDEDERSADDE